MAVFDKYKRMFYNPQYQEQSGAISQTLASYFLCMCLKERNLGLKNIEWLSSVSLISFRAQYVMFGNITGSRCQVFVNRF